MNNIFLAAQLQFEQGVCEFVCECGWVLVSLVCRRGDGYTINLLKSFVKRNNVYTWKIARKSNKQSGLLPIYAKLRIKFKPLIKSKQKNNENEQTKNDSTDNLCQVN